MELSSPEIVVFDLDGTLLDSDEALARAFEVLGVEPSAITYGHVIAEECARLGISLAAYLDAYDTEAAQPFSGVEELLGALDRWAVCSNKHPSSGAAELERLGWRPDAACFADCFDGPKRLDVVLDRLGVPAERVLYVGDTDHDRVAATEAGCRFVLAGWNPRARVVEAPEIAEVPADVLRAAGGQLLGPASP